MGKNIKKKKKKRKGMQTRQNKITMFAISGVVCMLLCVLLYRGNELQANIDEKAEEKKLLEYQIAEEEKRTEEILQIEEEIESEEFIRRMAREKFGLVAEDEIILKPEK